MKSVAISQSNYLPWAGYFDLINYVDTFVILDSVQYTRRDWRNRNLIRGSNGPLWLTVPVQTKGHYYSSIQEIKIDGIGWRRKHWRSIEASYKRYGKWTELENSLRQIILLGSQQYLSELNEQLITCICQHLGITTKFLRSSQFEETDDPSARLLHICKSLECKTYVSGPAAKEYLSVSQFNLAGINVEWFDYTKRTRQRVQNPLDQNFSVIDNIFRGTF